VNFITPRYKSEARVLIETRENIFLRGYMLGALVASVVAIAAYFQLFGGKPELFMLYSRARGTFNDPNVLAAFVVLPALLLFRRMLAGRLISAIPLLVLLAALFLTFSRGAWAQFAFAAAVLMGLSFLTSRPNTERLRILIIALVGTVAVAALVVALLSIGKVAALFSERASLELSYDVGRYGRFGRYGLGADLAMEHPFGIGPLQFADKFLEDPHDTFLNEFMSGGWLAGLAYFALCAVTLAKVSVCAHALAAALSHHLRGLCERRRRERVHRHRALAPLFLDSRRALGIDGGFVRLCASRSARPLACWLTAPPFCCVGALNSGGKLA
jgi:O-antigen ligase